MPRPYRILYVDLAPAVGGSVISLHHLVEGLDKERYQPHVVLAASNDYAARFRELSVPVTLVGGARAMVDDAEQPAVSTLRHSGLVQAIKRNALGEQLVHTTGFLLRNYPAIQRTARMLGRIIADVSPDLVHLNDAVSVSRPGILAARRAGRPALCHIRALTERNAYDRWNGRSLSGLICISQAVDRHQRTLVGRHDPSWVVYNGLDLDAFDAAARSGVTRHDLRLGADDVVIGCVGRLVPWKGQEVFLRALALLAERHPRVCGVIVGGPEPGGQAHVDVLRKLACSLGIGDRVVWTGFRQDVPRLISLMDVLVHASVAPEPFGRVLIEGMAARTLVVGTRAGAVPEIIEHGQTGLLVTPGDAQAMAAGVEYALDRSAEMERIRERARQVVERRFTAARYVRGIERVYEAILQ